MSQHEPTEPLHEALHSAVARTAAEHADYEVPEAAVRSRANRRRALRAAGAASLSLALLAGAGVAVATLGEDALRDVDPHATQSPSPGAHTACGQDYLATTWVDSWVSIYAEGRVPPVSAGDSPDLTVVLESSTSGTSQMVEIESSEGPALLAVDPESSLVVGYSRLRAPIETGPLEPGDVQRHSGFGPIFRCPGAPRTAADPYLAPGEYLAFVGQRFSTESEGLSLWNAAGELEITEPGSAPEPAALLGTCGSTAPQLPGLGTDGLHLAVGPTDLVSVGSDAPQLEVSLTNAAATRVIAPAQGGPAILVLNDSGKVVAVSRTTERVPSEDLEPGESFLFTEFEPLEHCETGEPLPAGRYSYYVARQLSGLTVDSPRAVDLWTRPSRLVVSLTQVDRRVTSMPALPVCKEPYDPQIPSGALRSSIEYFDVIEKEPSGDTGGGGIGPDNSVIDIRLRLEGPEPGPATLQRQFFALLREGVVVGTTEMDYSEDLGVERSPYSLDREELTLLFSDCNPEGSLHGKHVLDGEYTLVGYIVYDVENPAGVRDQAVLVVGPHEFEHRPGVEAAKPTTWGPENLPTLPACGERLEAFHFELETLPGEVTFAGYGTWTEEGVVAGGEEARPLVELAFRFPGETTQSVFATQAMVLMRDGVVVAFEEAGGWGGAQPETWEYASWHSTTLGAGYSCEDPDTELEPEGRYTMLGFAAFETGGPESRPTYQLATLGPVEVEFGSRP